VDGEYLSEDWLFCDMARRAGFNVFADTHVLLNHVGQVTFPLQSQVAQLQKSSVCHDDKRSNVVNVDFTPNPSAA